MLKQVSRLQTRSPGTTLSSQLNDACVYVVPPAHDGISNFPHQYVNMDTWCESTVLMLISKLKLISQRKQAGNG